MGEITLLYVVVSLVIGVVAGLISGLTLENKYRVWNWLSKFIAIQQNKSCQFSITTDIEGYDENPEEITNQLIDAFEKEGYKVNLTSRGHRSVMTAMNEKMEAFNVEVINDNPAQIYLNPVQTGIKDAINRFEDLEGVLDRVKNQRNIESISFDMVVPFNLGIHIKPPKGMNLEGYNIMFIHNNSTRISVITNNKISVNSDTLLNLKKCFKTIFY